MLINPKKTLAIFWDHTKGKRSTLIMIYISVIAATILGTVIPLYFKKFFDIFTLGGDRQAMGAQLVLTLGVIAGLEMVRWLFWRLSTYFNARFTPSVVAKLSATCFCYLHQHSFSYFNNTFVGSLVKRFNWFTRAFESVHDKIIWNILPLICNLVLIGTVLARRGALLTVALMGWVVLFLVVNWVFTRYKMKYDKARTEAETKASGLLADTITNNSNVKLFVGFVRETKSYEVANEEVRRLRHFTWQLDGVFDAIQGLLVIGLQIGLFYVAIGLWQAGRITVGDFVLLQTYVFMIFNEIWGFGRVIRYLYSDLTDAEEMTALLTTPHEIQDKPGAEKLVVIAGEIVFDQVGFKYNENRTIFEALSLRVKAHEKVALVGPSGAGKSTIIKLLLRMHDVTSGHIVIDGQKIDEALQESLWAHISLVPQEPILFHRSLMENIRYGRPEATDEEVLIASKLAHCHEFITSFPEGYATFVGERGVKLSGGERQRVAIARAILRNAPILILDEATSSLDSESEMLIQDALAHLMKDKTVIVIAHRLSTIMKMDRIIVVDNGAIREEGTHAELLAESGGLYSQLWKLQAGGFMPDLPAENTAAETLRKPAPRSPEEVAQEVAVSEVHSAANPAVPEVAESTNPMLL